MTSKQRLDKLNDLNEVLLDRLIEVIKAKTNTSADLAFAWKVLTDNGVPLANMAKELDDSVPEELSNAGKFLDSIPLPFPEGGVRGPKVIG